ncbi:MAG: hypothetical protein KDE09_22845 [Anaerolineales bacterium]|nr:hypothetical protein [Anaerolineales bacterium]
MSTTVERIEPPTATVLPATATPSPAVVTAAPVLLATPIPVNTPDVVNTGLTLDATYRDTYVGLALDYPSDWIITELSAEQKAQSQTYATAFQSWVSGPGGGDGIPEGGAKIDLGVTPDGTLTLDRALATLRELYARPDSDNELLGTKPLTLASGLPAVRVQTKSVFGESSYIFTVINGHQVNLGGIGDQAQVEQIAQTLRPLTEGDNANPNVVTARMTDVRAIRAVSDMVPVYSGPGETFPLITNVPGGFALAVSGITADARWYELAGCGDQNPNRPAPACWISADEAQTTPIRAITPSEQPVMSTEQAAVMVVANGMAPVHSGPAAGYPQIAQLAGGMSFPITGQSEDGNWWRLAACSSLLNEVLDECWISADPTVTEAVDALIPHGPQSSVPPQVDPPQRSGTVTITELPKCFNLDTGLVGGQSNPNCEFNLHPHESAGTLFFEPILPARFGFGGVFPEAPSATMCTGSQHLSSNSEVIAPLATLYVCYQTGEGRFGYLHFLDMTEEPLTATLEWQTFE